jgi:hypothetical protein
MTRRDTNACIFLADMTVRCEEKERNSEQLTCHEISLM